MPPFKDSFQDRVGRAAEAKRKALDKLRAKPPAAEEARAAEATKTAEAAASAPQPLSEAEKKAARDAKYAARKSRK
jgi:hypothetical protein